MRFGFVLLLVWGSALADKPPLTLEQALKQAAGNINRKPPLFLDCHNLAFNNTTLDGQKFNMPYYHLMNKNQAARLEVMRRFFDVLLADLNFAVENERMAVNFIAFDRARERFKLGEKSEIELARLENEYQETRQKRIAGQKSRELTRLMLAFSLGDVSTPPAEIFRPKITLKFSPAPVLKGLPPDKHQQISFLAARLELLKSAAEFAQTHAKFRELHLDQSRAKYEMELKSDLGFSMVWQSQATFKELLVKLCAVLTIAEINALSGKKIWPLYAVAE